MENPGFLSLMPAITAIVLAFVTKQVLPSLFAGVIAGGIVLAINTGDIAKINIISEFLLPAIGSKSFAKVLIIYLWCLGGLTGIWEKTGGAVHFAKTVGGKIAKGAKSSMFFSWIIGMVFHQGGTISTVLAGTTVKPVTDKHKVSHEELSYIVDSTASPAATVLPFNAWPGYVGALLVGTIPLFPDEATAIAFFFSSLPYNFYGFIAITFTFLFAFEKLPWIGPNMKAARIRARTTGKLDAPDAKPVLPNDGTMESKIAPGYKAGLIEFFLPIGVLLGFSIIPYVFMNINFINEAFLLCALSAVIVAKAKGLSTMDTINAFVEGCKKMTMGGLILALAITLGTVSKNLGSANYLVSLIGDGISLMALPGILALLCMGIAFSTGTSWGTYAVVFPIAMPLAYTLNQDPFFIQICFGAVIGGAVFGDQCSPISDTTILASIFTGCDTMDHVKTQLPLALAAATIGIILSTICVSMI